MEKDIQTHLTLIIPHRKGDIKKTEKRDRILHVLSLIVIYLFLSFFAFIVIFPFYYMIAASFMTESQLTTGGFFPTDGNILENIAFGLELQGVDKTEREQKARECMSLVKLDGYADMLISELSGGMQQRVGLARALANDPEVLLMDEAFSALDPLIRIEMQDELLALQSKMKKTIVFITHDLEEAIKLGDRIAIMRDGNVEQVGTSEEILTEPANAYIRNFVEKVERRRVITAASIMVDKPVVARLGKEGPEALIRKMKERKLTVLPVVNADGILVGEVRLGDLVELRQKQVKDITPAVREQVHSVLGDTVVDDILPLMTKTNSPIWVVNERREFEGVVPLASLIVEVTGKDKKEINEIIQNAIDL